MTSAAGNNVLDTKTALTNSPLPNVYYHPLSVIESRGWGTLSRLPYSIRILLESVLRNCDGRHITEEHVRSLAGWTTKHGNSKEIPFKPARVILQDFTGVPALVDLAAMRNAMAALGGDPARINPVVPVDLVIDHSVQIDHYGAADSLRLNEAIEMRRNAERYKFLKWGQSAFANMRVVPPSTGIVHQVNLEYLSPGVFLDPLTNTACPDSCVGTDSHTPMVNGMGVLAWGVGGIEAEAVMLAQPLYMLIPEVVGFKLTGELQDGMTATDLVLRVVEMCRQIGVVGKFVEFFGSGLKKLSVADRATISNMAPEQGATASYFPIDDSVLRFLRMTGRQEEMISLVEVYYKEQGLFREENSADPDYSQIVELDLGSIEPSVAGPRRPQDRLALKDLGPTYKNLLSSDVSKKGFGVSKEALSKKVTIQGKDGSEDLTHGSVVIASITSCTNTSNPYVMLAAGLLAKKAHELGLKPKSFVKTSLAPGSRVVTEYLKKSGLLPHLEALGFHLVGYGCATCIGNSGPLDKPVEDAIKEGDLIVSSVLSGNRNFEGRVHPLTRTNYLASPPLVVAYALLGSTAVDITREPLGCSPSGQEVFLKDIWPGTEEVNAVLEASVTSDLFKSRYKEVFKGTEAWEKIPTASSQLYPWDKDSTYIQAPPFFDGLTKERGTVQAIRAARVLGIFGDSVTTDHISPAGSIAKDSPAAKYLREQGVADMDFNSYGSRRGNDRVMVRGTFANIRIKNALVPGSEGNVTMHHPTGSKMSFFDAAELYRKDNTQLMIIAGKEYGSGSSRDWAAKGPKLLGIRAVIAESYERIHRSNLVGMGILPLQFLEGQTAASLHLDGTEAFDVLIDDSLSPGDHVQLVVQADDKPARYLEVLCRVDTPIEVNYLRDGGILSTVLKDFAAN